VPSSSNGSPVISTPPVHPGGDASRFV